MEGAGQAFAWNMHGKQAFSRNMHGGQGSHNPYFMKRRPGAKKRFYVQRNVKQESRKPQKAKSVSRSQPKGLARLSTGPPPGLKPGDIRNFAKRRGFPSHSVRPLVKSLFTRANSDKIT